jgi:hypothetical protein
VHGEDYVVSGEVRNATSFPARAVQVEGTVYDGSGQSLQTQSTVLGGEAPLQPGQQQAFTLTFRRDPRIVRYYVNISPG